MRRGVVTCQCDVLHSSSNFLVRGWSVAKPVLTWDLALQPPHFMSLFDLLALQEPTLVYKEVSSCIQWNCLQIEDIVNEENLRRTHWRGNNWWMDNLTRTISGQTLGRWGWGPFEGRYWDISRDIRGGRCGQKDWRRGLQMDEPFRRTRTRHSAKYVCLVEGPRGRIYKTLHGEA